MTRTFHKKGGIIEVKTSIPKEELGPKDVLEAISNSQNHIAQMDNQLLQLNNQKNQLEKQKEKAVEVNKEMSKFKDWAEEVQVSTLKNILKDIHQECFDKVESEHISLGDDAKDIQLKYRKYQKQLSGHPRVSESIYSDIISKYTFDEPVFDNPFIAKED